MPAVRRRESYAVQRSCVHRVFGVTQSSNCHLPDFIGASFCGDGGFSGEIEDFPSLEGNGYGSAEQRERRSSHVFDCPVSDRESPRFTV